MIDIKELRYGSWVGYMYEDNPVRIVHIYEDLVVFDDGDIVSEADPEEIFPIPLTEEILFRCGFSKDGYKPGHIGIDFKSGSMTFDFVLEEPGFMGEWDKHYTFELPKHRFVNVEHLHQLQNIFFAITKKELEYE